MSEIKVAELMFNHPDQIGQGIANFIATGNTDGATHFEWALEEIISVTHFVTAVQAPPSIQNISGQPQTQYQFRFIILYC